MEKGGAVLKMVSSSTGFLKGMMELSLASAVSSTTPPATVGNVNDGSSLTPEMVDKDTTPPPQSSNGPSSIQSLSVAGSGEKAVPRRLGKGLSWLRGRRRRHGTAPSSGEQASRSWWRRHDHNDQSATAHSATHVCPTDVSNTIPTSVNIADPMIVPDGNRSRTFPVRENTNDRQDAAAVGGVYEKRAMWLKRSSRIPACSSRIPDSDDRHADVSDENGTAASGFIRDAENPNLAISVISDGQSTEAKSPNKVNPGFVTGEPGSIDDDAKLNDHSGRVHAEVVLDPAALSPPLVAGDQPQHHHTSVAVDHVPPATTVAHPLQESDTDYRVEEDVHVVAPNRPNSINLSPVRSSETGDSELSPLSLDVDFLCNEIGRLVADYMRQHLVFLAVKNLHK